jgi:hypothetical protein
VSVTASSSAAVASAATAWLDSFDRRNDDDDGLTVARAYHAAWTTRHFDDAAQRLAIRPTSRTVRSKPGIGRV